MSRVVLVACASRKRPSASPAAELYDSALFRKARAYAEAFGDRWYVLSALHGLLEPSRVTEPYDVTLARMSRAQRAAWAESVLGALRADVHPGDTVVILAGTRYRTPLLAGLAAAGCHVAAPLTGMGIGRQLQWLTAATSHTHPPNADEDAGTE